MSACGRFKHKRRWYDASLVIKNPIIADKIVNVLDYYPFLFALSKDLGEGLAIRLAPGCLDADELQLFNEQLTCCLEILAQPLPEEELGGDTQRGCLKRNHVPAALHMTV